MRSFALFVSLPALLFLCGLALADRPIGTQRLWRAVVVGAIASQEFSLRIRVTDGLATEVQVEFLQYYWILSYVLKADALRCRPGPVAGVNDRDKRGERR